VKILLHFPLIRLNVTLDKPVFLAAALLILSSSEHTINDQNPLPNLIQILDSFML